MFKAIKFFAVFFTFLLLSGCASSCGESSSGTDDVNSNSSVNKVIVPKPATNANVPKGANTTNMVNGLTNSNMENPTLDNSKVKVINPDTAKQVEPPRTKLPDSSEMSTRSVGADFVQTRVFKGDPQLDKLEKIINGKDKKLKVYLKNGKTYDLAEKDIKDFKKDSAATILKAVGVTPVKKETDKDINNSTEKVDKK